MSSEFTNFFCAILLIKLRVFVYYFNEKTKSTPEGQSVTVANAYGN